MKIVNWNVRRLGSSRTSRRLRHMLKNYNLQIVFLIETKLQKRQMERVQRSCGFMNGIEVYSEGTIGGLCLAWRTNVNTVL